MSWRSGFQGSAPKLNEAEERRRKLEAEREEKRKKLEAERLARAQQRSETRKQIQAAVQSRQEATQALQDLRDIAPDIFDGEGVDTEEVSSDILEDSDATMPDTDDVPVNFEDEDGKDTAGAMREATANLAKFNWDSDDLLFTFQQIEVKMRTVEVKQNWTKFQVLSTVLPKNVQEEVKHVLRKQQSDFPQKDSYKQLKKEILRIFGPKPDDGWARALSRVLTGTPSQLARQLVNDICKEPTLGINPSAAPSVTLIFQHLAL